MNKLTKRQITSRAARDYSCIYILVYCKILKFIIIFFTFFKFIYFTCADPHMKLSVQFDCSQLSDEELSLVLECICMNSHALRAKLYVFLLICSFVYMLISLFVYLFISLHVHLFMCSLEI